MPAQATAWGIRKIPCPWRCFSRFWTSTSAATPPRASTTCTARPPSSPSARLRTPPASSCPPSISPPSSPPSAKAAHSRAKPSPWANPTKNATTWSAGKFCKRVETRAQTCSLKRIGLHVLLSRGLAVYEERQKTSRTCAGKSGRIAGARKEMKWMNEEGEFVPCQSGCSWGFLRFFARCGAGEASR